MVHSSTFDLRVDSDKKEHLLKALEIASDDGKVSGYRIRPPEKEEKIESLILFKHKQENARPGYVDLLYDMPVNEVCELVWGWLGNKAKYGPKPDSDDGPRMGFVVKNINWGSKLFDEEGMWAFAVIRPEWMEYWK